VEAFQPDVVNVHFPDAQIPIVLWLRRRRTFRLIVSLHGHEILRWFKPLGGRSDASETGLQRRISEYRELTGLLRSAGAVTACSRWLLNKAIELEPSVASKGHVIANGIDLDRFSDKTCFSHARPYVLAFGRLTYVKGFDLLLRAFSLVAPDHPGLDLLIAGDGEERAELGALAERLKLDGRVLFTGRATPAEIVRLLNGCAFVIVPSRSETFGISALEALAAGKPVLATRVGGLGELLGDGLGSGAGALTQLVEPTADGLAVGIRYWLAPQATLASQRDSHALDLSRFTWRSVADQYGEVYTRA
jgi:glycogen(starch) synthase